MANGSLREELEEAIVGLNYDELKCSNESDWPPFRFFTLPADSVNDLTPKGFLDCFGVSQQFIEENHLPIDQLIEEWKLEDFFPAGDKGFRKLAEVLRKRLDIVKVFRVGQIEVRCYVAGFDEHGYIAGLVTTSTET